MAQLDPASPEWWLRRLHARIVNRRQELRTLHDYYDGRHNLAFASQKFREAFGGLFRAFADNWCQIVVDATEERLNIGGFRIGDATQGDQDAWRIWQANELDAQSQLAHTEALVCGTAFGTVWIGERDDTPEITVESPTTAEVECHPKLRRQRLAGLRLWMDEWGYEHAELFLPGGVYLFKSRATRQGDIVDAARVQWVIDETIDGVTLDVDGSMDNPFGVVPMVPLVNRPRLAYGSRDRLAAQSEITSVIPVQDAVNKLLADMLVSSEYAAYPQRYLLGLEEIPKNAKGQDVNPYTPDKRVWLGEGDANTLKVGEFSAADLKNYVTAIEMLINHIASITRTPPHYLSPSADRLSGESIKAAETGLVAKVRRKHRHFGEAWEEIMRLAGTLANVPELAKAEAAETIWDDPESRTESQHVDAVVKSVSIGVPWAQAMEDLGYSPQQIKRMRAMKMQDALEGLLVPQPTGVRVTERVEEPLPGTATPNGAPPPNQAPQTSPNGQ
jgi:hypothetical protein